MNDPGKAVFLSYASQDAEAARRICGVLRAAGVEVWFDQSDLRGGDAWDQKIRRQIKECALFVPVISANTQARTEGYFRLEWRLADQRTHLMAKGRPFLVPVVIDGTRDADAHVPDSFTEVQWTRLPDGETSAAFCTRVQMLLGGSPMEPGRPRPAECGSTFAKASTDQEAAASPARRALAATGSSRARRPWLMPAAAGLIAISALVFWQASRPAASFSPGSQTPNSKPIDLPEGKSIAVLPFVNASDDKENTAFFSDGIHEDILTSLANIRDLKVISRTSVMEYRNTTKKIPQIARELGVAYVLEGSVRRSGNQVKITGQLIRAANDQHLWARSYDRELTPKEVFAIQAALATEIAGALRTVISPDTKKLLERRPTENLEAYECYLKAQAQISELGASRESMRRRIVFLQQAVDLDPNFAEAWGALATSHAFFVFHDDDHSPARIQAVETAMAHALRLAREVPEIIRQLGMYYYALHRDYARATAQIEKVLQLQPNNAAALNSLGLVQRRQGLWRESLANLRKAAQLEPRNVHFSRNVVGALEAGRKME